MSYIIYYSNNCENSKKIIKALNSQKDIHWLCIDKRTKEGNTTYIVLENGHKVVLPPNIDRVPALMSLSTYQTTFGTDILGVFSQRVERQVSVATQGNMEPMSFSFGNGGGFGGVSSDTFSSWELNPEQLAATGNGGLAQMHNYVSINHQDQISPQLSEENFQKNNRSGGRGEVNGEEIMQKLMRQREMDIQGIMPKGGPGFQPR